MEKITSVVNRFGKRNTYDKICVSLSGGVDSMVLITALSKYRDETRHYKTVKQFELTAVHINYNNRETCDEEVRFVQWYCELIGVPLTIRHITEMTRARDDTRHEYETFTKKIRYEEYEKQCCPILLGHNYEDTIENILANVASRKKYENLKGMQPLTIQGNVIVMRPLLNVSKIDIYAYAEEHGIPHLPDSTPEWSRRGKLRDHVIPVLQHHEPQLLKGLVALSEYVADVHTLRDQKQSCCEKRDA